jgi:thymidine phosphorylase
VDAGVGIYVEAKPGTAVTRGQPLARLRVRKKGDAGEIAARVLAAFTLGDAPPPGRPLVIGRVEAR